MGLRQIIKDAIHNKQLEKEGKVNKKETRLTTIGWKANDEQEKTDADKSPSGNDEYSTVISPKK